MKNLTKFSLLLILALAGCGSSTPTPTPTPDPTPTPTPDPDPPVKETYDVSKFYGGYYTSIVSWENGEDLKQQLHTLIKTGKNAIPYNGSKTNWESNQEADQDIYDLDCVNPVYTSTLPLKTETNTKWQREHVFAASLMTGFGTTVAVTPNTGRAVDFHNLYAAGYSGNSARGNKHFGVADGSKADYRDRREDNGKDGYSSDETCFEPGNLDKGRIARSVFYMGVMYCEEETQTLKISHKVSEGSSSSTTESVTVTYKPLEIKEECSNYIDLNVDKYLYPNTIDPETQPGLKEIVEEAREKYGTDVQAFADFSIAKCDFSIGNLSTLLKWTNSYPVKYSEILRNDSIQKHVCSINNLAQNNRNPFIDYPDLANYIYGSKKEEAGKMNEIKPATYGTEFEGSDAHHYAVKNAKKEYTVGETLTKSDYQIISCNKDFTLTNATIENTNPDYKFVASDIGTKKITLKTPINNIEYQVKVTAVDPFESFDYEHTLSGYGSGGDFEGIKSDCDRFNEITMKDDDSTKTIKWYVYWEKGEIGSANSSPSYGGVKFGKNASNPVGKIVFQTTVSEPIYGVMLSGNASSGNSFPFTIKVGGATISSAGSTIDYYKNEIVNYGALCSEGKTGLVEIEITNLTAVIYLNSIGLKFVND